jgi:hypothetical protein
MQVVLALIYSVSWQRALVWLHEGLVPTIAIISFGVEFVDGWMV